MRRQATNCAACCPWLFPRQATSAAFCAVVRRVTDQARFRILAFDKARYFRCGRNPPLRPPWAMSEGSARRCTATICMVLDQMQLNRRARRTKCGAASLSDQHRLHVFRVSPNVFPVNLFTKCSLVQAEHLESGASDADEAITQLVAVLDTKELADAINRLERGFGLRVGK